MKLTFTTIAALMIGTAAMADMPDLSQYNDGLPVRVMCSGAPAVSGSVNGVLLQHTPMAGYIIDASAVGRTTLPDDRILAVMPEGMTVYNADHMAWMLNAIGLTTAKLVTNVDTDRRTEVEEVTTVAERGVATGPVPERDNVTSMGVAVSDGSNVLRVRSSVAQDVSIRRAGGETFTVSVGAGDTLVAVPSGGTYIASFAATHRNVTKATGPQAFNDVATEEVEVTIRTTSAGRWCR